MAKHRNFTNRFMAKVASEALRGDKTVQEVAAKHQMHPNKVSTWKLVLHPEPYPPGNLQPVGPNKGSGSNTPFPNISVDQFSGGDSPDAVVNERKGPKVMANHSRPPQKKLELIFSSSNRSTVQGMCLLIDARFIVRVTVPNIRCRPGPTMTVGSDSRDVQHIGCGTSLMFDSIDR